MKKMILVLIILCLSLFLFSADRFTILEDFEIGEIVLSSYPDQDLEPDAWALNTENTVNPESAFSLNLFGNTWKVLEIEPVIIDTGDVWQISTYIEDKGEIQGFGISDGENVLFYSIDGNEIVNIEEWIPAYQGAFGEGVWNDVLLPIADDWLAWYDSLSTITQLIFINDNDNGYGSILFDNIYNISDELPIVPLVEIAYTIGELYKNTDNQRSVDVQFTCEVTDPDSDDHTFLWNFGDGATSDIQTPFHTFVVEDDHAYTVHLIVTDESNRQGYDTCQIEVDEGETSFPLTINFAGDTMLGRHYEGAGGIIPTQGVDAIFQPTYDLLGNAADISIVNLECPLTTHNVHHPTKTIYFKGNPESADGLANAGIDIVCLANNHVIDYMQEGMEETMQALAERDILYSGAGVNSFEAYQPLFYSKKGVSLAFLRSSDRTGQYNNYQPYLQAGYNKFGFAYMTPYYVREQIREVQETADIVIVETHSGSEYSTAPGANYDFNDIWQGWDEKDFSEDEDYTPRVDIPHMWDIEIRHFMIDSGADIVVCHHPHVIQGLEMYNGKLIAHSLGNFAFDLSYFETFPSMILNTKINENGFFEYFVTPVFIDDYIPKPATGELGNYILDYVAMRSKEMNTYLYVDRENLTAQVITDTNTVHSSTEMFQEELSFDQEGDYYVSQALRLLKWGNLSSIDYIAPHYNYEYRVGRECIWFGNFEDEGASMWNINSDNEWIDDEVSYTGDNSLCIHQNSSNGYNIITNMENRCKKRSEGKYSVHGYIKTEAGFEVTIQARMFNGRTGGSPISIDDLGTLVSGDTDWIYYDGEIEVPGNTNYFDVIANSECPQTGESYAWFDNVGLIEWSDWETLENMPTEIINPNDYYFLQVRTQLEIESAEVVFQEKNYHENLVYSQDNENQIIPAAQIQYNYPNPFNPETTISFSVAQPTSFVTLEVYNIRGQKVKQLIRDQLPTGKHSVVWNGTDANNKPVASGIYLFNIKINNKNIDTKKGLLLK